MSGLAAGHGVALAGERLTKSYGPVLALADVDFKVREGEILGLVGDNGAGKSTLLKILSGVVQPDGGVVRVEGVERVLRSARDARVLGIETVYQDLALINGLSVTENLFLAREQVFGPMRTLARRRMRRAASEYLDAMGIANIPSIEQEVGRLSGGQRQAVAVARAVFSRPRVLLLDEPTAAMGARETGLILRLVLRLRDEEGVAILFVNHNYAQLLEVADRINLLMRGEIVMDRVAKETSVSDLTEVIIAEVRRSLER
jgi:ABC-type sugar transport system ATPase subunit